MDAGQGIQDDPRTPILHRIGVGLVYQATHAIVTSNAVHRLGDAAADNDHMNDWFAMDSRETILTCFSDDPIHERATTWRHSCNPVQGGFVPWWLNKKEPWHDQTIIPG